MKNQPPPIEWSDLAKISPRPDKWIEVYKHYCELLTKEDVAGFWHDQYKIANKERNELKMVIHALKLDLEEIQSLNGIIANHNLGEFITMQYVTKQKELIECVLKSIKK